MNPPERSGSPRGAGTERLAELFAGSRLVDLTVTIAEDRPCSWPTHVPFQHKSFAWFEDRETDWGRAVRRGNYQTKMLVMDEHTGTHFDPPGHFIPPPDSGLPHASDQGLVSTEKVDPARMIGPAAVIDCRDLADTGKDGVSPRIEPDRILEWEKKNGELRAGDVVLLNSGWDRHYESEGGDAYSANAVLREEGSGWPSPSNETVELIWDRGVRCIGTDGASMGAADDGEDGHMAGLSRGMSYVEALTHLGELPSRGAFFIFLAIKVKGGTGGPGRAIALISDDRT